MHTETDLMLVLYVDDFLMSGPKSAMGAMWERIGAALKIDEPGPMGLYLGCIHEEGKLTLPCGRDIRYCTFNSEDFFRDKVNKYLEICETLGGKKVKLASVTTPYLRESARESCARKPEDDGEAAYMCKWCRHAFSIKKS